MHIAVNNGHGTLVSLFLADSRIDLSVRDRVCSASSTHGIALRLRVSFSYFSVVLYQPLSIGWPYCMQPRSIEVPSRSIHITTNAHAEYAGNVGHGKFVSPPPPPPAHIHAHTHELFHAITPLLNSTHLPVVSCCQNPGRLKF